MFGLAAPPWRFLVVACAGGSRYLPGLSVPVAGAAGGQRSGVIPPSESLAMPSLHLIGRRDTGRADSEAVSATTLIKDCF